MPPAISSNAISQRTINEEGLRSHRMNLEALDGMRASILSKYLSNSAFADVICDGFLEPR
ncbi:hypothetical protein [Bradyrhizobium sp. STM 3557]|uniref:hypothetical protein n=1 Tax=Bradyrhizobium sp. STM 3557 TaxID=578920 RepID=UPI00388F4E56